MQGSYLAMYVYVATLTTEIPVVFSCVCRMHGYLIAHMNNFVDIYWLIATKN